MLFWHWFHLLLKYFKDLWYSSKWNIMFHELDFSFLEKYFWKWVADFFFPPINFQFLHSSSKTNRTIFLIPCLYFWWHYFKFNIIFLTQIIVASVIYSPMELTEYSSFPPSTFFFSFPLVTINSITMPSSVPTWPKPLQLRTSRTEISTFMKLVSSS